jgi:Ca2+-transporting ATPase
VIGDPTEGALITVASKAELFPSLLQQSLPRLDSIPSESQFQYMATLHQSPTDHIIYVKGSVEAILA